MRFYEESKCVCSQLEVLQAQVRCKYLCASKASTFVRGKQVRFYEESKCFCTQLGVLQAQVRCKYFCASKASALAQVHRLQKRRMLTYADVC